MNQKCLSEENLDSEAPAGTDIVGTQMSLNAGPVGRGFRTDLPDMEKHGNSMRDMKMILPRAV